MSDTPKLVRIMRVEEKASGVFYEFDLKYYDVSFYALNEDGTAYTPPLDQPTVMVMTHD